MPKLFLEILWSLVDALTAMKVTVSWEQEWYTNPIPWGSLGWGPMEKRGGKEASQTNTSNSSFTEEESDRAKQTHLKALLALVLDHDSGGQRLYVSSGQHCAGHRINSHIGLMNEWMSIVTPGFVFHEVIALTFGFLLCIFSSLSSGGQGQGY